MPPSKAVAVSAVRECPKLCSLFQLLLSTPPDHHMNLATDPSLQVYGRFVNTYSVAAFTAQNPAAVRRDASLGGAGRCSTARAKGAVKYLQAASQAAQPERF